MEAKSALTLLGFRKRVRKASLPPRIQSICRSRAQKRWSALLTQTRSRIGCNIRGRLGEDNWEKFVLYAETNYKESFIRSLTPHSGLLCCSGKIDGSQCANNLRIDLNAVSDVNLKTLLPNMHMDHTHDVAHICDVWSRALPQTPSSWDDGICGELIAHLLFGTEDHVLTECSTRSVWKKQIVIRCGNASGANQSAANFCHDVSNAHYGHILRVKDITWPK